LPCAFPNSAEEAGEMALEVGVPLLIKPRTQVFLRTRSKGIFVDDPRAVPDQYRSFLAKNAFHPPLQRRLPGIEQPILQAFHAEAATGIYSITGFVGTPEQGVAARAAVKVLQRPRRLGVGLCFEEAPVDFGMLDMLVRIFRDIGYFGVFEAEFVPHEGSLHLIDMNPHFYGQMGFDTARSLPHGYLAWLAAVGEHAEVKAELERARDWQEGRGYVFCNRFFFGLMLGLQRMSGWVDANQHDHWRRWLADHNQRGLAFDSVNFPGDRGPATAAAVRDLVHALRHPRSFYRQMIVGP
ncbi:MAG TPA: hypothetical protein VF103_12700, partial [Polyangiaceae bacterium]